MHRHGDDLQYRHRVGRIFESRALLESQFLGRHADFAMASTLPGPVQRRSLRRRHPARPGGRLRQRRDGRLSAAGGAVASGCAAQGVVSLHPGAPAGTVVHGHPVFRGLLLPGLEAQQQQAGEEPISCRPGDWPSVHRRWPRLAPRSRCPRHESGHRLIGGLDVTRGHAVRQWLDHCGALGGAAGHLPLHLAARRRRGQLRGVLRAHGTAQTRPAAGGVSGHLHLRADLWFEHH
mmetsp:Transcript_62828/g.137645  ORF Transcript_62828/g.137645 Transcript_62828/m.137645 type:complete len:234 (+) Transcript_62828:296-997(+)